jgi:hypothetical protein
MSYKYIDLFSNYIEVVVMNQVHNKHIDCINKTENKIIEQNKR